MPARRADSCSSMSDHDPQDTTPQRSMLYDPTDHRIRSFVTRAGRLSTGQARAMETFGPRFCLPYAKELLDVDAAFGRHAPTILEIGTGMGETTAHIAGLMPEKNFIGVEVHTPGIGSLLKLIGERDISNLRLIQHDAFEVVTNMLAPASLAGVHVFFPDPWHKARHNKRRLIQGPFVELLCSRIAPGATFIARPTGKTMRCRCWKCWARKNRCATRPTAMRRGRTTDR